MNYVSGQNNLRTVQSFYLGIIALFDDILTIVNKSNAFIQPFEDICTPNNPITCLRNLSP